MVWQLPQQRGARQDWQDLDLRVLLGGVDAVPADGAVVAACDQTGRLGSPPFEVGEIRGEIGRHTIRAGVGLELGHELWMGRVEADVCRTAACRRRGVVDGGRGVVDGARRGPPLAMPWK